MWKLNVKYKVVYQSNAMYEYILNALNLQTVQISQNVREKTF